VPQNDLTLLKSIIDLKKNEKKTMSEINNIREVKFRKLLKYAYNHSSFYHELYTNSGIKSNQLNDIPIDDLPPINKNMIINNFERIITLKNSKANEILSFAYENRDPLKLYKDKYQVVHSSGSSGTSSVTIYSLKEMAIAYSLTMRMLTPEKGKFYKTAYYAGVDGRFAGASFAMQSSRSFFKKYNDSRYLDINASLGETIDELNDFQPNILTGYGMGIAILAKNQEKGRLKIKPEMIIIGGEAIASADYQVIKDAFHVPVNDLYGASECYCMGIGKEEYNGIYLMEDYNYIEIMDDHILVTNLFNYTQPVIRYRIDDILTLKHDNKKLLPFRLIDRIVGRDEMLIWFKNEKGVLDFIHPIVFTSLCIQGIEKFQIILSLDNSFEFLAIMSENCMEEDALNEARSRLDEILRKKDMTNVTYKIRKADHPLIDRETRKFKIINTVRNE